MQSTRRQFLQALAAVGLVGALPEIDQAEGMVVDMGIEKPTFTTLSIDDALGVPIRTVKIWYVPSFDDIDSALEIESGDCVVDGNGCMMLWSGGQVWRIETD